MDDEVTVNPCCTLIMFHSLAMLGRLKGPYEGDYVFFSFLTKHLAELTTWWVGCEIYRNLQEKLSLYRPNGDHAFIMLRRYSTQQQPLRPPHASWPWLTSDRQTSRRASGDLAADRSGGIAAVLLNDSLQENFDDSLVAKSPNYFLAEGSSKRIPPSRTNCAWVWS